jgi:hypothetical protein
LIDLKRSFFGSFFKHRSSTMKRINNKNFFISLFPLLSATLVVSCGAAAPGVNAIGSAAISTGGPAVTQITNLVSGSTCINTSWNGRGKAPAGYIKGVTLSFARSFCRMKANSSLSDVMNAASSGNSAKDALTYYESTFANLNISVASSGDETLRALYTLGMGLGMRESSGSYCEGWDRSAGSNRTSAAAEAGAFQTSFDSIVLSPELSVLYAQYKASPASCFLNVFKEGASCGPQDILGTGAGAEYQAFNKSCPAFATEYAMTMLRISRGHYGPINRKDAQVVPACNELLQNVQNIIENDPSACNDLL